MDPIYEQYENIDDMPSINEILIGGFDNNVELTNQPDSLDITPGNIHNFEYILKHRATWHFLFVGWSHCPYCQEFNKTYEELVTDKSLLKIVRFMRILSEKNTAFDAEVRNSIKHMSGIEYSTVPALFLVIPKTGEVVFIKYECSDRNIETIRKFIEHITC